MFQQNGLKGNWNLSMLLLSYIAENHRDPGSQIAGNEVFKNCQPSSNDFNNAKFMVKYVMT